MKSSTKIKLWVAFTIVVLFMALPITMVFMASQEKNSSSQSVLHTQDVLFTSEKALSSLLNIETSARGYTITHRMEFLDPYLNHKDSVKYYFNRLQQLTIDNASHQRSMRIITPLLYKELSLIEKLTVMKQGALSPEMIVVRLREGKVIMDQLRAEVASMQRGEKALLLSRTNHNNESTVMYNYLFMVLMALFAVLLVASFILISANMTQRALASDQKASREEANAFRAQLLLRSSIESLKDIMVYSVDLQYRILNFNSFFKDVMFQMYGTVLETGANWLDCITQADDRALNKKYLDHVLEGKGHLTTEDYRSMDQSYFETRFNPINNAENKLIGVTVLTINITERRKAEIEVARLASIVESSSDAIISKSLKGTIISWNKGAEILYGYTAKEALGKNISFILPKNQLDMEADALASIWDGEVIRHCETKRTRKDGKVIDVSIAFSPIKDQNGNIVGGSGIGRDISWQKEAEESIKQMNEDLKEARRVADLANLSKSQFLANMSHEIRTPLNAVIGLGHLVLQTDLNDKQKDYLMKIQSSSESLLSIINDILDFSKIESGKLTLEEVSFDLEEIFQKLATIITYRANAKGMEIAFGIDPKVPNYLIGDPGRINQILINLCGNAIKFTDDGEVVVSVTLEDAKEDLVQLKFEIKDTGVGMNDEQMSKLFKPFVQGDGSISRKYGGTGLGLSISKRLANLMDGAMWVESEPGRGSRFYFTIWLKKLKEQRKMPVLSIDLRNMHVLVVDDNKSSRKIIVEALKSLSFQVTPVNSGIQAIHYLKNNHTKSPVRLILMDWKMPGMDGLEAARLIRQDAGLAGIKIIIMCTSFGNDELFMDGQETTYDAVLIKPIRYSLLYDLIIATIGNSRVIAKSPKLLKTDNTQHHANLLLVEDNEINQQVATELLEEFGFTVEVASSGLEAVQMMQNSGVPSKYNLILMDLRMPVMNGFTATVEIRKLPDYKDIPIIAMTADAMTGVREDCLAAGLNDFITKPIDPRKMLETIEKWLGHPADSTSTNATSHKMMNLVETGIPLPPLYGVDITDGLVHVGGNKKFLFDLLFKFAGNYQSFGEELIASRALGDWTVGHHLIHTMKGTSGNLGMVHLFTLCKELEEDLLANPLADATIAKTLLDELTKVIDSILANIVQEVPVVTELLPDTIIPQLFTLEKLLNDHDPESINLLNKIGMIKGLEEKLEKIKEALASYDFDTAIKTLKEFRPAGNI